LECEICGRDTDDVYEMAVDGARMLACAKCAGGRGKPLRAPEAQVRRFARPSAAANEPMPDELVENFGEMIRIARDKLGLPLAVLAERISEKESTLVRIEKQKTMPSEKTRVKLEKELGIKLTSKPSDKAQASASSRSEPVTLWDLVSKKKEGKGG
jgi:putative transcription factor